jgi:arsenate reductase-like glutaredoxin family protein
MKSFINPMKVEDPYYVAHIKGREDELSDEEFADLFNRFPDLLKKPITTKGSEIVLGPDVQKLESLLAKE